MTEQFPDGEDRQVEIIGQIIETMQGDPLTGAPASAVRSGSPEYSHRMPPPVDFKANALRAVEGGIFVLHSEPRAYDEDTPLVPVEAPDSLLDTPYGNGPSAIEADERDIPVAIMGQLRKNFVAANRLLLPTDQLMLYFHQCFSAEDPFSSRGIARAMDKYKPETPSIFYVNVNTDDVSFSLDVDRTKHDRHLFTEEELMATLDFTAENPALAVAIAAYEGTILDYLEALKPELRDMAGVTWRDLEKYDVFISNWATPNFFKEIMPALMLFARKAGEENPGAPTEELMTPELFHDALDFLFTNGAFRNFVDVPAHVAQNGKQRVNKFLCPAVNAIREQLIDGSLLHQLYTITQARLRADDDSAFDLTDKVREKVYEAYDKVIRDRETVRLQAEAEASPTFMVDTSGMDLSAAVTKAMFHASYRDKAATFILDGVTHTVEPSLIGQVVHENQPGQPGDYELHVPFSYTLHDAVSKAADMALSATQAVHFSFNEVSYRLSPEDAKKLFGIA